jgi:Zn-finger nucleic acid-binding protein
VALPLFSPALLVRNERDRVTARAGEFFFLRLAARRAARRQLGREIPAGNARCPRCRRPLRDARYEGAVVEACPSCRGLLVPMAAMDRILVRKEFAFSEELVRKAAEFKKRALAKPAAPSFLCPRCGARMAARPYNYEFFIPVDKCLSCRRVWFDADELESLQILTEKD